MQGSYQLLVYTDKVNILGGSIYAIKKNKAALVASKEIGLRVNADKTKYMIMSCEENAGKNHNTETGNKSFERVEHFQCLATTLTSQNCIHEKLRADLSQGMLAIIRCRRLLSSSLLSKNIKIKIHSNIILPVVLYGCETWSLTVRNVG